jgi:hypothetical protein
MNICCMRFVYALVYAVNDLYSPNPCSTNSHHAHLRHAEKTQNSIKQKI